MALKIIMLNPKAVKLFAKGRWEAEGRPTPLVTVTGNRDEVILTNTITGERIGHGHLSGTRESPDGDTYYDANTSHGVRPRGKGYGLALYCGLAMQAHNYSHAAGVSSPDGGGAVDLWEQMVESGLATGEGSGDDEQKEESTEVSVEVALPEAGWRRGTAYADMMSEIRSALDIPDEVEDDDIEVDLEDSTVQVPVTVRWKEPSKSGFFLSAHSVDESGLIVGGYNTDTRLRIDAKEDVPEDLIAAIPIADKHTLRNVVAILQQLGRDTSISKMLAREDLQHLLPSEGRQIMIPGVPPHYPRPAPWNMKQASLPGVNGLGGGRRGRGLGDLPRGLALSAKSQGILHRYGDID